MVCQEGRVSSNKTNFVLLINYCAKLYHLNEKMSNYPAVGKKNAANLVDEQFLFISSLDHVHISCSNGRDFKRSNRRS